MNDWKPFIIIGLPGNANAVVAIIAWKDIFPKKGELIYPPSARCPNTENKSNINAKLSFFHWFSHLYFLFRSALFIFSKKSSLEILEGNPLSFYHLHAHLNLI